jgi:ABC-2 type transport system permease protein
MNTLRVAWALEKAAVRAQMEYRLDFIVLTVMGIAYQASGFAFIWVVLKRFHTIDGWTFHELAFLYALRLVAHVAFYLPFNQVSEVDRIVREGTFDQILVRPMNPLLQVMTSRFSINILGDFALCVALFCYAATAADVNFSPAHVLYLVLAVIGGGLAEGALVLVVAALAFRFLQTWAANYLVDSIFLMFGSYPMRIFGATTSWVFTWILPVAFVAYIPSSVLLGRTGDLGLSPVVAWGAPVIGLAWFLVAYRVWVWQLRSYQSSGT